MAVGDCSVTERRRWRPPYQTGKTVHVHAKHYKHNEDGRTAPGVCGNGSVPLSHSGNVVTRIGIHTHTHTHTHTEKARISVQLDSNGTLRVRYTENEGMLAVLKIVNVRLERFVFETTNETIKVNK